MRLPSSSSSPSFDFCEMYAICDIYSVLRRALDGTMSLKYIQHRPDLDPWTVTPNMNLVFKTQRCDLEECPDHARCRFYHHLSDRRIIVNGQNIRWTQAGQEFRDRKTGELTRQAWALQKQVDAGKRAILELKGVYAEAKKHGIWIDTEEETKPSKGEFKPIREPGFNTSDVDPINYSRGPSDWE